MEQIKAIIMSTGHIEFPQELEDAIRATAPVQTEPIMKDPTTERIIDALQCQLVLAQQMENQEEASRIRERLFHSSVRGSYIEDIKNLDDVITLLTTAKNWREVVTNLEDKSIICLQGELSDKYRNKAYAAYVTVDEIYDQCGDDGLKTVNLKRGYQKEGEYYLATILRMPTNIITVQLKLDESGTMELMKQWFVGREKTSIFYTGTGDELVRCSCKPQKYFPQKKRR
jgi:predicted transposase YbfD/YdcC